MNIKEFLFKNQTIRQTIAKNTFWLFFGQIVSRLIKAALIIYAARILGAESYGIFSFALSFAMLALIFSDMGIGPLLVRETAKNQDEESRKKYISTSFYLKIFLLFVCLSLMLVGILILPNKESAHLLWFFTFMIVATIFRDFFLALARSLEKMEIEAATMIIEMGAIVILGFVFLRIMPTPQSLALAYGLGAIIGLIFPLAVFRRRLIEAIANFDGQLAKKIAGWAWPFAVGSLIGFILAYTDTLMLGWLKPIETVGWYAAAIKIPLLLIIPAGIVHNAILPALSRLSDSGEKLGKIVNRSGELLMALVFPLIIGGIILAPPIINLIFGKQYLPSVPAFKIALFLVPINCAWSILSAALFAKNLQQSNMYFAALAAGTNIILNLILIPVYGITGAALASVFSQSIGFSLTLGLFKKITRTFPFAFKELAKISLAALAMSAFLLVPAIRNSALWLNIPLAGLIYFMFLRLLKFNTLYEGLHLLKNAK